MKPRIKAIQHRKTLNLLVWQAVSAALGFATAPALGADANVTAMEVRNHDADKKAKPKDSKAIDATQTGATATSAEAAPVKDSLPTVEVIGSEDKLSKLPSAVSLLKADELQRSHVFTTSEALRKAPGVHVRDEEGMGLRPNIGMRGMNPTRSTKTLLLEDGLPLSYAPYGDNASYYHPPIERYDSIEVMKGSGQNLFGPQTIGGLVNYLTPEPPEEFQGKVRAIGGNRDYFNGYLSLGGYKGLLDVMHKRGQGARDNTDSELYDLYGKKVFELSDNQSVILRGSYYSEDSQLTYSGLTQKEYELQGHRYNPFKNDHLKFERWGLSGTHQIHFTDDLRLTTSAYGSIFERDWWRQASTTSDSQCGSAFTNARRAGEAVDPDSCNSLQGRLRRYYTYGFESRLFARHHLLGVESELETGVRAHYEIQRRDQKNLKPLTGTETLAEDRQRYTDAYSAFLQNRFIVGDWTFTPNVRVEHILNDSRDALTGSSGNANTTGLLPGFGMTWTPIQDATLFFSMHRGYSPPRTEDLIVTGSGGATYTDVEAEKSWNYELGARTKPIPGATLEVTGFHNDFENLISVGSIAGGSTPLAQSQAKFEGVELLGRLDSDKLFHTDGNIYLQLAHTWLPTAKNTTPVTQVSNDTVVAGSVAGNRLPYAPEQMVTTTLGYTHTTGWDIRLEAVHVGKQWADFANTRTPTADGQKGQIAAYTILNLAATYPLKKYNTDLFVTVKNLTGHEYIVDRTRGILPGTPLLVQGGFEYRF